MPDLKKWLTERICFDKHTAEETADFSEVLSEELDRITIYHADCREFFLIDPDTVLQLANDFDGIPDTLDGIVRKAIDYLAFDYMYNELQELYDLEEVEEA